MVMISVLDLPRANFVRHVFDQAHSQKFAIEDCLKDLGVWGRSPHLSQAGGV